MTRHRPATVAILFVIAATLFQRGVPANQRGTNGGSVEYEGLAKDILRQLVQINTTQSGSTTRAAEAIASRLSMSGFPAADVRLLGPTPDRGNLVARLRGRGSAGRPIILMAHLDVVDALASDWSADPFVFRERDGWFYGRGTTDDKDDAAIWTTTLIRLKREGYVPDRDIILMLTADEETGQHNGVDWLLKNHRELVDATYALNEGGGGVIKRGRRLSFEVQASEKIYQSFEVVITNSGGHSSLPRKDNAINQLAAALTRLSSHKFPIRLNEVTRAFFDRTAAIELPEVAGAIRTILQRPNDQNAEKVLSAVPEYNARLRTTCVATMLEAGHAETALPQRARAVVNCRILPDESPKDVLTTLVRVLGEPQATVKPIDAPQIGPASPLSADVMGPIEEITKTMWPGIPVIPTMSTGATDGLFLRRAGIPVYGVSGVFDDADDVRAHGRDERIRDTWFYEGLEFGYRLVKRLTGG